MINIIKLYQDFNISFQLPGHKHVRHGWIGTECPFCSGHSGFHLGYCIDPSSKYAGRFICWRCGGKKTNKTFAQLLKIQEDSVWATISAYSTKSDYYFHISTQKRKAEEETGKTLSLPSGTKQMSFCHRDYLRNR